jgi:hypothetical protein
MMAFSLSRVKNRIKNPTTTEVEMASSGALLRAGFPSTVAKLAAQLCPEKKQLDALSASVLAATSLVPSVL